MIRMYLFHTEDGKPVFDGDMIWMLVRGNSLHKKRATYKNPKIYSANQTIARHSIDYYTNKCFHSYGAMIDYYKSKNTIAHKILNAINELI